MSSSSTLYVLSFVLMLQTVYGADPLFHFCSNSQNFTTHSPYEQNLNKLLADLYFNTPPTGFGSCSVGQYQAQTYGLSLCRGDVSSKDCQTCIMDASTEIRKLCPDNEGAVIWYDNCLLKYSDTDFFGEIDDQNKFYLYNINNVTNPKYFNMKTTELLSKLAEEAFVNTNLYATGEAVLGKSQKLYGLVQCTRDLSSVDCKKCLDEEISELPSCCDGKEGGRVISGSCNFRYEIYPFVNA